MFDFKFDNCSRYKDNGNLKSIAKVIQSNAASQMQRTVGNMTSFLTKKDKMTLDDGIKDNNI